MNGARQNPVVLAAGGSGGHVFPAEALAKELAGRGLRLVLITDRRGDAYGGALGDIDTHRIRAGGIAGKSIAARLKSGPELAIGTWQARSLLKHIKPSVVVGFGGYASVPTMLAATFGGYKTVIHEQNAILGRANRLLAGRVDRIATSFEATRALPATSLDKVLCCGMPVRAPIIATRDIPYPPLGDTLPLNILVLGGSQGASVLSDVIPKALALLDKDLRSRISLTQQCRPEDLDKTRSAYERMGLDATLSQFFDDVPKRMAAAHLLIGRSGASTVAEATVIGRPAILVPYPHAIDDHQTFNAHALDEAGGGWLMSQDTFTAEGLSARLQSLLRVPEVLQKAAAGARAAGRPDAAILLADMVCDLLDANGERRAA